MSPSTGNQESRNAKCSGESDSSNFNSLTSSANRGDNMLILFPLTTPKDQMELFYPRRLILGLWRVYGQFAVKMMRFQLAQAKSFSKSCSTGEIRYSNQNGSGGLCNSSRSYCNDNSVSNRCECQCLCHPQFSPSSSSPSPRPALAPGPVNNSFSNLHSCQKSKPVPSDSTNCSRNRCGNLPSPSVKSTSSSASSSCHFVKFSMGSWTFLVLFFLLLLLGSTAGCGPGRGAGRRRAPRKLTPLVYKQHVPNVPENTLSASGLNEGRITRDHQRFKNLVPNYNQDIIFRDDEGSGADRLMTQRCKEKLNTLAISVMNQWPGVKLRVIEGWDEENLHAPQHSLHSLHYEGRAVDITTSDKDRSKYGMLARLAVEAGFDWVYYESRAHIHCSVKSDSTQAGRTGGCFSGNSTVETPTGSKKISDIQTGDQILTMGSDGKEAFSDVLLFLDRNTSETREFFVLKTNSGTAITLTPSHLIYTVQPESLTPDEKFLFSPNSYILTNQTGEMFLSKAVISFAKNVQIGDWILVKLNSSNPTRLNSLDDETETLYSIEKVMEMEVRVETGVYAPLTSTGNLIVDGVLASCYAVIDDQGLAHSAFLPLRLSHNLVKGLTYIWRQFSRFISFRHSSESSSPESSIPKPKSPLENPEDNEINNGEENYENGKSRSSGSLRKWEQGVHWYANTLYTVTRYLLPSHLRYDD